MPRTTLGPAHKAGPLTEPACRFQWYAQFGTLPRLREWLATQTAPDVEHMQSIPIEGRENMPPGIAIAYNLAEPEHSVFVNLTTGKLVGSTWAGFTSATPQALEQAA